MIGQKKRKKTVQFHVLGVMSGTSLDGLDLASAQFRKDKKGQWHFDFTLTETIPYPKAWQRRLAKAHTLHKKELEKLDFEYTKWLSKTLYQTIKKYDLEDLKAICSHGHTVLHQPEKGITLQIGNLPFILNNLNCPVVCDFRTQDVALGGQGAPLVPVGDHLLFPKYTGCLNLGGIANLSKISINPPKAYDVCAFNQVFNYLSNKLGLTFDESGHLASKGKIIEPLLEQLNALSYYSLSGPKSLGKEWVEENIISKVNKYEHSLIQDVMHTYAHHCALQIGNQWNKGDLVLVTGGGAHNHYFMETLTRYSEAQFEIPEHTLVNFKEALIFGLLGVLKLLEEVNCYAAVTGAKRDHVAGNIFFP